MPNWGDSYWNSETDFEIHLVIDFDPFTFETNNGKTHTVRPVFSWKRARQPVRVKDKLSIALTPHAKKWAVAAAQQLRTQWIFKQPIPQNVKVTMPVITYHPTARLIDASNLYQGPEDVLQVCQPQCKKNCKMHAGILTNDSQVENHDGSARRIDRVRPRFEITIKPYRERK